MNEIMVNIYAQTLRPYTPSIISAVLLTIGLTVDYIIKIPFFNGSIRLIWYALAYLPVAIPVIKEAWEAVCERDWFNEFTLMSIATLGAFLIGEYPEGVAVMLFYAVGELFQESAVNKARDSIKALLDIRPKTATVIRGGTHLTVDPATVGIGEHIRVKAGEQVPLDGTLLSKESSFNTSAITGESTPRTYRNGETILAGMLNINHVVEIRADKAYEDSSLARILVLVQDATARKAKTELLIRKLAGIYTPIVFGLAVAIIILPYFFVDHYQLSDWVYRALVFLVISCPCALVISIPLGYFGGIGAASHNGILFKGANYLDLMTKINTLVMDKTGTLTEGVFEVRHVSATTLAKDELVAIAASAEQQSNHPIAKAICTRNARNGGKTYPIDNVQELAGHGIAATCQQQHLLIGNAKLMKKHGIFYDPAIDNIAETTVVVAIDHQYAGYIIIADTLKSDIPATVQTIKQLGIEPIILSGDSQAIVGRTAKTAGVDIAIGHLLPEEKSAYIRQLKQDSTRTIAFMGDGINDAPALAVSDVGIAMGCMGSDAAIEVADVVIQTDQPHKVVSAIRIGKATKRVIMQNITIVFLTKGIILTLGALGMAGLWAAVFADVGVALIAIANAVRILRKRF